MGCVGSTAKGDGGHDHDEMDERATMFLSCVECERDPFAVALQDQYVYVTTTLQQRLEQLCAEGDRESADRQSTCSNKSKGASKAKSQPVAPVPKRFAFESPQIAAFASVAEAHAHHFTADRVVHEIECFRAYLQRESLHNEAKADTPLRWKLAGMKYTLSGATLVDVERLRSAQHRFVLQQLGGKMFPRSIRSPSSSLDNLEGFSSSHAQPIHPSLHRDGHTTEGSPSVYSGDSPLEHEIAGGKGIAMIEILLLEGGSNSYLNWRQELHFFYSCHDE